MLNTITRQLASKIRIHRNITIHRTYSDFIKYDRIKNIGSVILNRPKQLNAFTGDMAESLISKLKEFECDDKVKAVVIKSNDNRAFCCGGDIKRLHHLISQENWDVLFKSQGLEYKVFHYIHNLKKPYVSLLSGITMGSGGGISIHGKYRVATERTTFAMPETAIGLFVDVAFYQFFEQCQKDIGLYFGLTGTRIKGKDVKRLGIATHFINEADLKNFENDLVKSNNLTKEIDDILKKYDKDCSGEYPYLDQIRKNFTETDLEKIYENLKKDNSEWSKKQLNILERMSPSSLMITMKQYHIEKNLSLADAIQLDYRIAINIMKNKQSDFLEGVRTVLIDKGEKPIWNPPTITNYDSELLDSFFKELGSDKELDLNYVESNL